MLPRPLHGGGEGGRAVRVLEAREFGVNLVVRRLERGKVLFEVFGDARALSADE